MLTGDTAGDAEQGIAGDTAAPWERKVAHDHFPINFQDNATIHAVHVRPLIGLWTFMDFIS